MARTHDLILGVDLDNVVADYTQALRECLAAIRGDDPTLDNYPEPQDWDFDIWGLDRDAFAEVHAEAVRNHDLFGRMRVIDGAVEVLQQLSREGVRIRIVTARLFLPGLHEATAAQTVGWLDRHKVPYWDLCMITRKTDVGCDVYVDDSPGQIEELREANKHVVVMDWPYNQHMAGPRAKSWWEADRHIRRLLPALG